MGKWLRGYITQAQMVFEHEEIKLPPAAISEWSDGHISEHYEGYVIERFNDGEVTLREQGDGR